MFPHGLMFHHFCDDRHPRGQGAIDAGEFRALLGHTGLGRILPAQEWLARAQCGKLRDDDLCITLDDNLRCQHDVALPVLNDMGLTAIWFIYTSPLEGLPDRLELYRYYRTVSFSNVDEYYDAFFAKLAETSYADLYRDGLKSFDVRNYLSEYPFYSDADRRFRFVRDRVLGAARYADIMDAMIADARIDVMAASQALWMGEDRLRELARAGHVIGLHSHTHPTTIAELPREEQVREYAHNARLLARLSGGAPIVAAHPCNSYSDETLAILRELGVKIAFRSNMAAGRAATPLEMPREDHANLLQKFGMRMSAHASAAGGA